MEKIKLLVLSNISKESYTIPAIEKHCKKRGVECRIIDIGTFKIKASKNGEYYTIDDSQNLPFKISSDDTAVLCRRGVLRNTRTASLVQLLEDNNFFVVNSLSSMNACENKYVTSKILEDAGILIPKMALVDSEKQIETAIDQIGGKFPIVVKLLSGSQGIGVFIVDSLASLKSVLQSMWKVDPTIELLFQEKIESSYDVRAHVLTRKFNSPIPTDTDSVILGYMRRNQVKKDFRTNYSLGGSVEKTELNQEQESISIAAAKAIGCHWCGVDFIVDKKTGKSYVLEVNASPGTKGLKTATGIDVLKDVLDFILDKANWIRSKKVCGFREVIEIPGIGQIVSKMDTGNGASSCSLTYSEMKESEDGKMVEWSIGDKKFKNKIVGHSNAEVGDKKHERPIIELDIRFAGKLYKKVHVSLVDRTDKSTKFLANRKFMMQIGCSVNPMKTFVLSSFSDEYGAKLAKGEPLAGIIFEK